MAYQDPYYTTGQYGAPRHTSPPPQQHQYADGDFNPYTNSNQPYQTYDRGGAGAPAVASDPNHSYDVGGGYRDEPFSHTATAAPADLPYTLERGMGRKPSESPDRLVGASQQFRNASRGRLWTKGGPARTCCRFFFCTLFITVFLVLGVILSLALWIRPPNITIGDVNSSATTVSFSTNGLDINLPVNISINNPNYLGVDLRELKAEVFYPINNTAVGGGILTNIKVISNGQTNFTFPFAINYKTSLDPSGKILADLIVKCGASPRADLTVNYKITLSLKIAASTIKPSYSDSLTFQCPVDAKTLGGLITAGSKRDSLVELNGRSDIDVPPGLA